MKMRLVGKQVAMDPVTFAPELLVTIAMPLEPMQDHAAFLNGVDEVYERIGAEFVRLLKTDEIKK
jgi:hypothetical protein